MAEPFTPSVHIDIEVIDYTNHHLAAARLHRHSQSAVAAIDLEGTDKLTPWPGYHMLSIASLDGSVTLIRADAIKGA